MNFDFSDEQNLLRGEVRKYLAQQSPLSVARTVLEGSGTPYAAAVWQGLVDLGATSLMLPDDCGGSGLGALESCVVAEEVGRQLAAVPLASTLYLAVQAILLGASPEQRRRWLAPVAGGAIGAFAAPLDGVVDGAALPRFADGRLTGSVDLVADGMAAQWAVVLASGADDHPVWVASDLSAGLARRPLATLDMSKPVAAWTFEGTPAEALGTALDARVLLARVRNRAAVLLAFEQLGSAEAALEMAAAYARTRHAFGRTIGSYQGIKHKLVDLYNANQLARVHCYYGAWALAADVAAPAGAPDHGGDDRGGGGRGDGQPRHAPTLRAGATAASTGGPAGRGGGRRPRRGGADVAGPGGRLGDRAGDDGTGRAGRGTAGHPVGRGFVLSGNRRVAAVVYTAAAGTRRGARPDEPSAR